MSDIAKINVGGTTYGISGTSLIAPVETSSTASQQYLEGDQFVYNGVLYKATTTIPNGGTITVGSNCQLAGDVTSQISEISSNLYGIRHDATLGNNYYATFTGELDTLNAENGSRIYGINNGTNGYSVTKLGTGSYVGIRCVGSAIYLCNGSSEITIHS